VTVVTRAINVMLAFALLGVTGSGSLARLISRLPSGKAVPKIAASCLGSPPTRQLGTDNLGLPDNVKSTTIVNIWGVERQSDSLLVGYAMKTFNGTFWYTSAVQSAPERIDERVAGALLDQSFTYVGCFTGDLPLPKEDY